MSLPMTLGGLETKLKCGTPAVQFFRRISVTAVKLGTLYDLYGEGRVSEGKLLSVPLGGLQIF